jgi:hypothetical protein
MIATNSGLVLSVDGDYLVIERDGEERREHWPVLSDMLGRLAALMAVAS